MKKKSSIKLSIASVIPGNMSSRSLLVNSNKIFSSLSCSPQLPPCYSLADCSSAPASCDAKTRPKQCAKLEVQGPEDAKWNCGDINPYHSDIPAGTVCTTS